MHSDSRTSEDYVKDVLGLPANLRVESIISFGYPDEEKPPIPKAQLEYTKLLSTE